METVRESVRILLAVEQSLFRDAVKSVLEQEPDFQVVAVAPDGFQAVAEAERTSPDVAIVDTNLPNFNGIRSTSRIKANVPNCKVLVLSTEEDPLVLTAAVEAGASGFLTKDCPIGELIDATRAIYLGDTLIPPRMLGGLLTSLSRPRRAKDDALRRISQLTRREREVLVLLAEGARNDAIARALVISPQTARTHIQNVLGKLGVHSRLEAGALARHNGIIKDLLGLDRSIASLSSP
jgi:DNA-binding NarL/FixJ family response regulator